MVVTMWWLHPTLRPYLCCLQMRALAKKANKTEKLKNSKGGHQIWTEIGELGALIRWDLLLCRCTDDGLPRGLWCGQASLACVLSLEVMCFTPGLWPVSWTDLGAGGAHQRWGLTKMGTQLSLVCCLPSCRVLVPHRCCACWLTLQTNLHPAATPAKCLEQVCCKASLRGGTKPCGLSHLLQLSFEDQTQTGWCCREGNTKWEDLNLDDIDVRMKWAGMFHRRKKTPGKFMMRLKVSMAVTSARSCQNPAHQIITPVCCSKGRATWDLACFTIHHSCHSLHSLQTAPGGCQNASVTGKPSQMSRDMRSSRCPSAWKSIPTFPGSVTMCCSTCIMIVAGATGK